jgi:predicted O-linked N-acetylglucosamine transferase (SPINDLY family)
VQATWLGYPGTTGVAFFDYVLVDRIVAPPEDQAHFSEKLVWLPEAYQVNDDAQAIAPAIPSRADCGLPDRGFVFCCFNASYKIEPMIFATWMEILRAVPGSVLWLFAGSPAVQANLRRAAAGHGLDPARLVFAPHRRKDEHLARHRHADLFLDTYFYNAHTTASDALWAGVPLLTLPGRNFAQRVAASLLTAIGLPELIAPDLATYRRRAIELAGDPAALAALRARLAANRLHAPLFDTARFARHLEKAYRTMWDAYTRGEAPRAFAVPALPPRAGTFAASDAASHPA